MTHRELLQAITNNSTLISADGKQVQVLSRAEHGDTWRYTITIDGAEYSDYSRGRITALLDGKSTTRKSTSTGKKTVQVIDTEEEFLRLRLLKIESNFQALLDSACTNEDMRTQLLAMKAVQVAQAAEQAKIDWARQAEIRKQLADAEGKYEELQKALIKQIRAGEYDSIDLESIKAALANVKMLQAKL